MEEIYWLTVDRDGPRTVVAVGGEIDLATAAGMASDVRDELARGAVLLDLAGVTFMDSSGVRALHDLLSEADRQGRELIVGMSLQRQVEDVMKMTGLLASLPRASGDDA